MAKEKTIEVTLAKGQSLVGPGGSWVGGDTLPVSVERAALWQHRGMIEPLTGADAKAVAAFLAKAAKETAEAAAPEAKETAEG